MLTPTADAFLASTSFIACANLLLAQVQGLGAEAPHNKVKGMMRLWQKWRMMQGGRIMWERDGELLEWCMARYCDNAGAECLAPFANNFAPFAPSFDEELEAFFGLHNKEAVIALLVEQDLQQQKEFWQEVAKESEADAQRRIANSLEALACEGLGLGEATGAGEGSWQGQGEEEEGAKEKTPETMAGAAIGATMPAAKKAPTSGTKGLVSPAKKGSPTKLASKHRGCPMPRYEAPTQQDFSDKELVCLLVLRRAEVVVDMGVEAGVVLKETKSKAMVDLATHQAFKKERGACDKCWADNDPERCWYPVGAPHASGNEEKGSSKRKRKASLPLSLTDKGEKRARVVSPMAVTPEMESEGDKKDEVHCLGMAIEASKAAPGGEDLVDPSHQAEAPQDVGTQQEDMEQEAKAKVRPEAAP
ncbi:hypothetical protein C0993_007132 [Termitomyces sp. T159_Od127]|nr:hypothetical protein C0993_007132 [Termitomyces sp. T159_Od127]